MSLLYKSGFHTTKLFGDRVFDVVPDYIFEPGALYHKKSRQKGLEQWREKMAQKKAEKRREKERNQGGSRSDDEGTRGRSIDQDDDYEGRRSYDQSYRQQDCQPPPRGGDERGLDYDNYTSGVTYGGSAPEGPYSAYGPEPTATAYSISSSNYHPDYNAPAAYTPPGRRNSVAAARYTPAAYAYSPQYGPPATAPATAPYFPRPPMGAEYYPAQPSGFDEYQQADATDESDNEDINGGRRGKDGKKKDRGGSQAEREVNYEKERAEMKDTLFTLGTVALVSTLAGSIGIDKYLDKKEKNSGRRRHERRRSG